MIAESNMIVDGQEYKKGEEIWDLGSFECTGTEGKKRFYSGLSVDAPHKLPTYDDLATDSTAKCLDTGDFYYYHAPSKRWYQQ